MHPPALTRAFERRLAGCLRSPMLRGWRARQCPVRIAHARWLASHHGAVIATRRGGADDRRDLLSPPSDHVRQDESKAVFRRKRAHTMGVFISFMLGDQLFGPSLASAVLPGAFVARSRLLPSVLICSDGGPDRCRARSTVACAGVAIESPRVGAELPQRRRTRIRRSSLNCTCRRCARRSAVILNCLSRSLGLP